MKIITCLLFLYTTILPQEKSRIQLRDGKIFDKGFELTEQSSNAPEELKKLSPLIGEWNVKVKSRTGDSTFHTSSGYSRFSYLNRGHSIMEKFYCGDFSGKGDELNTLSFIAYNSQNKIWNIGLADSYKENIAMYTGKTTEGDLILFNSVRKGGWLNVHTYKYSFKNINKDNFEITVELSLDDSNEWVLIQQKQYKRVENDLNIIFENDSFGEYNNNLPEEARQFDFLIGEWDAHHELFLPNGNHVKYSSTATAVYVMNGNAIMEHDWFDARQGVTDAGTSLIRIYNRAMRRWECLFLTNRNNANYYFGGVKEGEKIVLHGFETDVSSPAYSYFIFYNISENDYSWHGLQTKDKGKTFSDTWTIEVDKKK